MSSPPSPVPEVAMQALALDNTDGDNSLVTSGVLPYPSSNSSAPDLELLCQTPCRHHPIYAKCPDGVNLPHLQSLSNFVQHVSGAVQSSFPRSPREYDRAHALFIHWEHDDIDVLSQIERLEHCVKELHFTGDKQDFTTSIFKIKWRDNYPNMSSMLLQGRLVALRNEFALEESTLLIIYYGGHAKMSPQGGGNCIWYARKPFEGSPFLDWTRLVNDLVQCDGNILFILDCCCGTGMVKPLGYRGFKELLAACGKKESTSAEDHNAFTNALIDELENLEGSACNINTLQSRLLKNHPDLHSDPIRVPLSVRAETDSIVLYYGPENSVSQPTAGETVAQQEIDSGARVLFVIRLEDPAITPRVEDWIPWIKTYAPAGIASIDVDLGYIDPIGIFQSGSTLLMASLPIAIWNLLPEHPGYSFVGLVESGNLLGSQPLTTGPAEKNPTSSHHTGELVASEVSQETPDLRARAEHVQPYEKLYSPVTHREPLRLTRSFSMELVGDEENDSSSPSMPSVPIAVLAPGLYDSQLHISFEVVAFSELRNYSYEALTYAWRYDDNHIPIIVRRQKGSEEPFYQKLYLHPSLVTCLQNLRKPDREVHIWVDRLCIDFSDSESVTTQFSRIGEIYFNADFVHVWLGVNVVDTEVMFDVFGETLRTLKVPAKIINRTLDGANTNAFWNDFVSLLGSQWFSRRWIIQEMAFASNAVVHVGSKTIEWSDFTFVVTILLDHRGLKVKHELLMVQRVRQVFQISEGAFRKSLYKGSDALEPVLSLEYLVCALNSFECTDVRDVIYSFLAIAKETAHYGSNQPHIVPIYSLISQSGAPSLDYSSQGGLYRVHRDFVKWVVTTSGSLDIICRPWLPPRGVKSDPHFNEEFNIPSWIQTVDQAPLGPLGRQRGCSLVGLPGRSLYCATSVIPIQVHFSGGGLIAGGLKLGEITWASDTVPDGVISKSCLTKAGCFKDGHDHATVTEKLWRTLVADRGPDSGDVPAWYRRACGKCLEQTSANGHLDTGKIMAENEGFMYEFLKRVQSVVWNRVFIESRNTEVDAVLDEGLFGIAPPSTEVGDFICLLFGCSVPVILRPVEDGFQLVGESFIYQAMDGQYCRDLGEDEPEVVSRVHSPKARWQGRELTFKII